MNITLHIRKTRKAMKKLKELKVEPVDEKLIRHK
jgi:hypothetical protein